MTSRVVAICLGAFATLIAAGVLVVLVTTAPAPIGIEHVSIIDPSSTRPETARRDDQTILVSGTRIMSVGDSTTIALPDDVRRVDGTGLFAVPGMIDMHVHFNAQRRTVERVMGPLMIANGVMAARDMFSDCWEPCTPGMRSLEDMRRLQQRVEDGGVLVPRLLALSSPLVHGPRVSVFYPLVHPSSWQPSTASEGRQLVAYLQERGVDFVKTYESIPRAAYFAMLEEAAVRGIAVAGHLPRAVDPVEAARGGARSLEHARWPLLACAAPDRYRAYRQSYQRYAEADGEEPSWLSFLSKVGARFDEGACVDMLEAIADTGMSLVPTHVTQESYARAADSEYRQDPRRAYVPPDRLDVWDRDLQAMQDAVRNVPGMAGVYASLLSNGVRVTGLAHEAGVGILVGTDAPSTMVFPGFSYHDELQHLSDAGLDPLAVVRAATYEAAVFLGQEQRLGTIERGKMADFVLLSADPLADTRNLRRIAALVYNGQLHDRADLDRMLSAVRDEVADW